MRNRATTLGLCLLLAGLSNPANAQPADDETAGTEQAAGAAQTPEQAEENRLKVRR